MPVESALMAVAARPQIVFTQGRGSWLRDADHRLWLDFVQGWAVNTLGHCSPIVVGAIETQARLLINPSPAFHNEPSRRLAERLCAESCLDQVFFTNSGAEANEGAIKLARKWGRQHRRGATFLEPPAQPGGRIRAQTAEFAGGASLQFLEGVSIEISGMRIQTR